MPKPLGPCSSSAFFHLPKQLNFCRIFEEERELRVWKMIGNSRKWAYIRIITGTIVGGVLGFYVMHRVELGYKEKMKERLKQYENELKKKDQIKELEDSL